MYLKRIVHLALYSKSKRVRSKNIKKTKEFQEKNRVKIVFNLPRYAWTSTTIKIPEGSSRAERRKALRSEYSWVSVLPNYPLPPNNIMRKDRKNDLYDDLY